jgi:hypothetical protein
MRKTAIVLCAMSALFCVPAAAEQEQDAQACLAKAGHNDAGLSPLTKQTRDRLFRDPAQIAAVIDEAATAEATAKTEIELGVARATERLKCVDPAGYQALTDYLKAHADNPVVAEIESALSALAQTAAPGAGGAPGGGGGLGGGGGGFSGGGGAPVSPH